MCVCCFLRNKRFWPAGLAVGGEDKEAWCCRVCWPPGLSQSPLPAWTLCCTRTRWEGAGSIFKSKLAEFLEGGRLCFHCLRSTGVKFILCPSWTMNASWCKMDEEKRDERAKLIDSAPNDVWGLLSNQNQLRVTRCYARELSSHVEWVFLGQIIRFLSKI